jgi:hypothetical protein
MSNQELIEILAEVRWEADRKAAAGMVVSAEKLHKAAKLLEQLMQEDSAPSQEP